MVNKMNANKAGLALGVLFGLIHLIWALLVLITPTGLKSALDWILGLHFMQISWSILSFDAVSMIILVVITFVCGYIIGWVFAKLWNWMHRK